MNANRDVVKMTELTALLHLVICMFFKGLSIEFTVVCVISQKISSLPNLFGSSLV